MKTKRFTAIILAALMLSSFTACGETDMNTDDKSPADISQSAVESEVQVEEETEIRPDLPERNYDGADFNMFMRVGDDRVEDMYVEELTGETMNDAIFERNAKADDDFNVEIIAVRGSDDFGLDVKSDIIAGDDTYDILIPHGRFTFPFAFEGLLYDWNSLEYVELDNPWWNDDARNEFSIAHHLFAMTGDISYKNLASTFSMYFNKNLVEILCLESPYDLVLSGDWTLDKFIEMSDAASLDVNGDGQLVPSDDRFGYATGGWGGPMQVLYSANLRIASKDEDDNLVLTVYNETSISLFEKYFGFIEGNSATMSGAYFKEGRLLFVDGQLGGVVGYRDMDDDFGIVPWPKYTKETDGYYSMVDAGCNLISIPITCKDTERASIILEYLAYLGYKNVIPQYYDVVLASKYARDVDSSAMLDIIRAGRVLDIGYYFYSNSTDLNSTGYLLSTDTSHNFASLYNRFEKLVGKQYDRAVKNIKEKYD